MEKEKKFPASFTQQHNHGTKHSGNSRAATAELRQKARAGSLQEEGARFSLLREDRHTDGNIFPSHSQSGKLRHSPPAEQGQGTPSPTATHGNFPAASPSHRGGTGDGRREGGGGASRDSHPLSRRLSQRRRGKLCIPLAAGTMREGAARSPPAVNEGWLNRRRGGERCSLQDRKSVV